MTQPQPQSNAPSYVALAGVVLVGFSGFVPWIEGIPIIGGISILKMDMGPQVYGFTLVFCLLGAMATIGESTGMGRGYAGLVAGLFALLGPMLAGVFIMEKINDLGNNPFAQSVSIGAGLFCAVLGCFGVIAGSSMYLKQAAEQNNR